MECRSIDLLLRVEDLPNSTTLRFEKGLLF